MTAQETTKRNGRQYRWYKCSGRIRHSGCDMPTIVKAKVEDLVLSVIKEVLARP